MSARPRQEGAPEEASSSGLSVRRLGGAIGAEVRGVHLGRLDDATFAAVRRAFLDHLVLVFPDQELSPSQQVAFTARFGAVEGHPLRSRRHLGDEPAVHVLENLPGHRGGRNDWWHSDISFGERPPALSLLYAHEVPDGYGDTLFANMYRAYEDLSDGMRRMLDGLSALHGAEKLVARNSQADNNEGAIAAAPPAVEHPVVRTHPETGRKALYVNEYFTRCFAGMTEAESRPLLDFLLRHATRPEYVYRHRWTRHDVLMWDNRCTMHYAVYDYDAAMVRVMHRTTAAGDRPR